MRVDSLVSFWVPGRYLPLGPLIWLKVQRNDEKGRTLPASN